MKKLIRKQIDWPTSIAASLGATLLLTLLQAPALLIAVLCGSGLWLLSGKKNPFTGG